MELATVLQVMSTMLVAGSLLNVARQIRLTRRSVQGASYRSFAYEASHLTKFIMDMPELGVLWQNVDYLGGPGPGPLSDDQQLAIRLQWFTSAVLDHYENLYVQHALGNMPERLWTRWEAHLTRAFSAPGVLADRWPQFRGVYNAEFVKFVDGIVAKPAGAP